MVTGLLPVRLGGFVIHGNNADTLERCLRSIAAVADDLVAVDSCSTDGSAELARAHGFRTIVHPWEGYGAARAVAVEALAGCDYVFFLDSDEWLLPDSVERLRAWKRSAPAAPQYSLTRRDWAELPTGRFLFRTERHVCLVRTDAARWDRRMIVHEALPRDRRVHLPVAIEHRYASDLDAKRAKLDRYALLWALRFHREGRRPKPAWFQRAAYLGRGAILSGAVFRGGAEAWRLADAVARYHARKHELLREVRAGRHADLVRALEEGRLRDLHAALPA